MKLCAYCGRENEEDASHCRECGMIEFALAQPVASARPATMKATYVWVGIVFVLLVLSGVSFVAWQQPTRALGLCLIGTPSPCSGGLSFVVSNESDSLIHYTICPVEVKSNGLWTGVRIPLSPLRMTALGSGQTTTVTVSTSSGAESWRVPLLWGYESTRWQRMKAHALAQLTRRAPFIGDALHELFE